MQSVSQPTEGITDWQSRIPQELQSLFTMLSDFQMEILRIYAQSSEALPVHTVFKQIHKKRIFRAGCPGICKIVRSSGISGKDGSTEALYGRKRSAGQCRSSHYHTEISDSGHQGGLRYNMKMEYLYIDGYKGLKRLKLQFKEQTGAVPVDFLIGCNGSGKSSVLEAVGLIFTRIMQNELPGFIFELKYRMPDGTGIYVKPQKKGFCDASGRRRKLYVELEKNGKTRQLYSIPDEYLPDRIISYCSGANSSMEDILIRSPRASLASDLYDLSLAINDENGESRVSGNEGYPGESSVAQGEAAEEILSFYERLDVNPRVLFLDAVTSKFILPALFAVMPFDMQDDNISTKALHYASLRKKTSETVKYPSDSGSFFPSH